MATLGRPTISTRERRAWSKRLLEAQEAVEAAEAARNRVMAAAYDAGVSYANVESATGLGPHTVRNYIDDARGADEAR